MFILVAKIKFPRVTRCVQCLRLIVEQTLHYFEEGLCLLCLLYSVVFMNSLSDN